MFGFDHMTVRMNTRFCDITSTCTHLEYLLLLSNNHIRSITESFFILVGYGIDYKSSPYEMPLQAGTTLTIGAL